MPTTSVNPFDGNAGAGRFPPDWISLALLLASVVLIRLRADIHALDLIALSGLAPLIVALLFSGAWWRAHTREPRHRMARRTELRCAAALGMLLLAFPAVLALRTSATSPASAFVPRTASTSLTLGFVWYMLAIFVSIQLAFWLVTPETRSDA